MSTTLRTGRSTSPSRGRFARPTSAPRGRFARPTSAPRGRFARSTATPRRTTPMPGLRRRRQPEPSGIKKLMKAVMPVAAARKATPSSKKGKAGGLALAAAAAGMAFKNRDKLAGMRHKDEGSTGSTTSNSPPPATPAV